MKNHDAGREDLLRRTFEACRRMDKEVQLSAIDFLRAEVRVLKARIKELEAERDNKKDS